MKNSNFFGGIAWGWGWGEAQWFSTLDHEENLVSMNIQGSGSLGFSIVNNKQ